MSKFKSEVLGDLERLKRYIEKSDFDIVIATSPENVLYISDVFISTQVDIRDRLALVVWDGTQDPILIICQVEEGYVRQESWITNVRTFKEFFVSPIEVLAELIRELKVERGNIGIEMNYLPAAYYSHLKTNLPNAKIGACDQIFSKCRMYKTPKERKILQEGFRGTEKALMETYRTTKIGESERDLSFRLVEGILRSGAESVAFNHINAGPNTGFPHMDPSNYRVQLGDILKADAGGRYKRYYSNVGRTAKLGKLSNEDRSWWSRLREIHHEIIDMVRPGHTGKQLFERATQLHQMNGIPFPYAHNGHGIGLLVHEHPLISPHEVLAYEPGMVTTVETRVIWPGKKGYHMEDLVEVTKHSPILLSDYFDNECILVI